MVKKQIDLTKYLMRSTLDERIQGQLNQYMDEDHSPSNLDPINHNWLDPAVMDYDNQNILDKMIQEQIDSQIQPILKSKIQSIVDFKCSEYKANFQGIQEKKQQDEYNTIEQLIKAEFEVQNRTLSKNIEETVKAMVADRDWVRKESLPQKRTRLPDK